MSERPICIFDSGIGGLTVAGRVMRRLPGERIIYFGDTARVPYGIKSLRVVKEFARQDTRFLLRFQPKLMVIACHTASCLAAEFLAKAFPRVRFIDVVRPSVEKALALTVNGKIGVIGTPATIKSKKYELLLKRHDKKISVTAVACPLFVPLIEEGWAAHRVSEEVARIYLAGLRKKGIDTLILGCTHYPVLKSVIGRVMGKGVRLVDASEEVARKVAVLTGGSAVVARKRPVAKLYFSDCNSHLRNSISRFIRGRRVKIEEIYPEEFLCTKSG